MSFLKSQGGGKVNRKKEKSLKMSEELSREYNKVNMEAMELMGMPNTDKKRIAGKGASKNQFR